MRIIWSPKATKRLRQVASYIHSEYGSQSSTSFLKEAYRTERLLAKNPLLGSVEPYLENAPVTYRSVNLNRLKKIVYWINDDVIEIVDFWDCRRDPEKLAEQTLRPEKKN